MVLFQLAVSLASVLLFAVFYGMSDERAKRARSTPTDQAAFAVFERGGRRVATRRAPNFSLFFGLLFAGAFYLALPIMIWRYGWRRAVGTLLACIVGASAGAFLIAAVWHWSDPAVVFDFGSRYVLGQCVLVPIRGFAGVYVAKRDGEFRCASLAARGWARVWTCSAASARGAVQAYETPMGPPKPEPAPRKRWWHRLRSLWPRRPRERC